MHRDGDIVTSDSAVVGTRADRLRLAAIYRYARIQFPALAVPQSAFEEYITHAMVLYRPKVERIDWPTFFDGLYVLDCTVCCGCLLGLDRAWEVLFNSRTGRSDCLLVDALRARAYKLYPRDEGKQENAVTEFWSHLLVPDSGGATPILKRYDGQRPLAPWLIRVFQNWHLSKLRQHPQAIALPDDDIAMPLPSEPKTETRWHESFVAAARDWLNAMPDAERLILGLRWRYKMSQRDVATLLGVHEGTVSRQTDHLRKHALDSIGNRLVDEGWTGDDLQAYILTEMAGVLVDDPRLSAEQLHRLVQAKGKALPSEPIADG